MQIFISGHTASIPELKIAQVLSTYVNIPQYLPKERNLTKYYYIIIDIIIICNF
jgi:hypothetical protein